MHKTNKIAIPTASTESIGSNIDLSNNSAIIQSIACAYMESHPKVAVSDLIQYSSEMLEEINDVIEQQNYRIVDKKRKLPYERALPALGIAHLLHHTGLYAKIRMPQGFKLIEFQINGPDYGSWKVIATSNDDDNLVKCISKCNCKASESEERKVYKRLLELVSIREETLDEDLCCIGNGIWNFKTQQLLPFSDPKSTEYTFLRKIHTNYNPNATTCPVFYNSTDNTYWNYDSWLKELVETDELVDLIWEITHGLIRPSVNYNKAVFLCNPKGNGANGKSTLTMMWKSLLGEHTYGSINLTEMGERFALAGIHNYNAIISDENEYNGYVDKCAKFKALVTHNEVKIEDKYEKSYSAIFRGLIVQLNNSYPKTSDKSGSFYRRLLMLPFNKSFKDMERKYIQDDYMERKELLEYVLYRILHMDVKHFSEPQIVKDTLSVYRTQANPLEVFCEEFLAADEQGKTILTWNFIPFDFLHDLYIAWYERNYSKKHSYSTDTLKKDVSNWCDTNPLWKSTYQDGKTSYKYINQNDMNSPEMTILEYRLINWTNHAYTLSGYPQKSCIPDHTLLKERYSGIIRQ